MDDDDLAFLKSASTGSGRVEVHFATAASDYQELAHHVSGFDPSDGPNGTWTLFIADLSAGEQSTLLDWGLDITAVPEPVTSALLVFAGVLGCVTLARKALTSRAKKSTRS